MYGGIFTDPFAGRTPFDPMAGLGGAPVAEDMTLEEKSLLTDLVANVMLSRQQWMKTYTDPRRDVDKECGYEDVKTLTTKHYKDMWDKSSTAQRVVTFLPEETWLEQPKVYENEDSDDVTQFEMAWDALGRDLNGPGFYADEYGSPIWEKLQRVDVLSGIGSFGIVLLGFDDGKELREPLPGFSKTLPTPKNKGERDKMLAKQRKLLSKGKTTAAKKEKDANQQKVKEQAVANLLLNRILKPIEDMEDDEIENLSEDDLDSRIKEMEDTQGIVGEDIAEPWEPKMKLNFVRVYDQSLVQISQYETDKFSPRYGKPVMYQVTISDFNNNPMGSGIGQDSTQVDVHWSRVIHVADNLESSEDFGSPRMKAVWHHLCDLRKLYGGSTEMMWRGGFPGLAFETHPNQVGPVKVNAGAMKQHAERYFNSLQRYLFADGMSIKTISPQVTDPTKHIDTQINGICIKLGVPVRIFMGSERGELSSAQDSDTWSERIKARRRKHVIPNIIVPFIDRLILTGVLPEPLEFHVTWGEDKGLTPAEQADIASKRMEAMSKYVGGGVDALMAPHDMLTREMGYDEEEADAILENAVSHLQDANPEADPESVVPGRNPSPPVEVDEEGNPIPKPGEPIGGQQEGQPGVPGSKGQEGVPPKGDDGKKPKPSFNMAQRSELERSADIAADIERLIRKVKDELTDNAFVDILLNAGPNCGVGKGGFQPGNTCAKGGGGFSMSKSQLKGKLSDFARSKGMTLDAMAKARGFNSGNHLVQASHMLKSQGFESIGDAKEKLGASDAKDLVRKLKQNEKRTKVKEKVAEKKEIMKKAGAKAVKEAKAAKEKEDFPAYGSKEQMARMADGGAGDRAALARERKANKVPKYGSKEQMARMADGGAGDRAAAKAAKVPKYGSKEQMARMADGGASDRAAIARDRKKSSKVPSKNPVKTKPNAPYGGWWSKQLRDKGYSLVGGGKIDPKTKKPTYLVKGPNGSKVLMSIQQIIKILKGGK